MSIVISGIGFVTPLGWQNEQVWERLCAGESGIRGTIQSPVSPKLHRCARVEGFNLDDVVQTGRVRRSSPISHFAVGAAALAFRDAQLTPHGRIGVLVAATMGGVKYSRSFHQEFIRGGGRNVSPMLFPETVFNAPASHIAAVFGLTDVNYTLIGDACSATNALAMASDLIGSGILDQCLVVATEELDWITVEGFAKFGLVARPRNGEEAMRPFDRQRNGFLPGEGAVGLLLESKTSASHRGAAPYARLRSCDRGFPYHHRREIPDKLRTAIAKGLESSGLRWTDVGAVFCSANGTFLDAAEATVLSDEIRTPHTMPVTSTKGAVGESHAASCLFQVAAAALAARHGRIPPTIGTKEFIAEGSALRLVTGAQPAAQRNFVVLCIGFNEQVSVVVLSGV